MLTIFFFSNSNLKPSSREENINNNNNNGRARQRNKTRNPVNKSPILAPPGSNTVVRKSGDIGRSSTTPRPELVTTADREPVTNISDDVEQCTSFHLSAGFPNRRTTRWSNEDHQLPALPGKHAPGRMSPNLSP